MRSEISSRICVSIIGSSVEEFIDKIGKAKLLGAKLIELRLDGLRDGNYVELLDAAPLSGLDVICTIRSKEEGGRFDGEEGQRLKALVDLSRKARFIDVEYKAALNAPWILDEARLNGAAIILSRHLFSKEHQTESLEDVASKMGRLADVVKIVNNADSLEDVASLLALYKYEWSKGRLIAFCMGERWTVTRIMSLSLGAPFTYASLEGEATAPGQPSFREVLKALKRLDWMM